MTWLFLPTSNLNVWIFDQNPIALYKISNNYRITSVRNILYIGQQCCRLCWLDCFNFCRLQQTQEMKWREDKIKKEAEKKKKEEKKNTPNICVLHKWIQIDTLYTRHAIQLIELRNPFEFAMDWWEKCSHWLIAIDIFFSVRWTHSQQAQWWYETVTWHIHELSIYSYN